MPNESPVLIVGAGELGQAIGKLLSLKYAPLSFWDADPARVPGQKTLSEAVPAARYVFFCVPSWAVRQAVAGVVPFLKKETTIVAFSKGLDEQTQKTMGELLPELLPEGQPCAVVGGPMLAEEIDVQKMAVGVIASKDKAVRDELAVLFGSPSFAAVTTEDMFSVSLASVLKNIYAVALGIADGLGCSGNEKGWVTSRAVGEMLGIAKLLQADPDIILGIAGLADFIATGYSTYSRNRAVGNEIAKTGTCNLRGEGLVSLPILARRMNGAADSFPLFELVKTVGIDCAPARNAFDEFFKKSFS